MYIAINEAPAKGRELLSILPAAVRRYTCNVNPDEATEMRLIVGKPFTIRYPDGDYYLTPKSVLSRCSAGAVVISQSMMDEMLEKITRSSLYSVKEEIRNGYITIEGGHRVGIAGTAVTDNGNVEFIKNISAMNIRIAAEIKDASNEVIGSVVRDGQPLSTLVVSPPCAGKTTLLRDIARKLSYMGFAVAIADERCELAAMYRGKSPFDLGITTSVMDNCPKDRAMLMLLRSMSPDVIVTDEIGTLSDVEAIQNIMNSGVAVIASIHGRDTAQLEKRKHIKELLPMFDTVITLSKRSGAGTVEDVKSNA